MLTQDARKLDIKTVIHRDKGYQVLNGTYYHADTAIEVIGILEQARQTGTAIVVAYGDTDTGKDWQEQYDVSGKVGRSMGPIRIPLLIPNSRSMGGSGMLDHCIVKIVSRKGKRHLYAHSQYHI